MLSAEHIELAKGRRVGVAASASLIDEHKATVVGLLPSLSARTLSAAVRLASLPDTARGFGHVKLANADNAKLQPTRLLEELARLSQPLPSAIRNIA
jgi:indolepyruvate ferredoxin oxidoreductase